MKAVSISSVFSLGSFTTQQTLLKIMYEK